MPPLWLLLANVSTGLVIESGSADALCPDLVQTQRAVADRIGQLEVPAGKTWRAHYTSVHSPSSGKPDVVRLELQDPEGSVRLERDLPLQGQSCREMAQVIALVLDRYFRSLSSGEPAEAPTTEASVSEEQPRTTRNPEPQAAAPSRPSAVPAPDGAQPAAAPRTKQRRVLWLGPGAGWSTPERGLALELAAQAEPSSLLQVGLSVISALSEVEESAGHQGEGEAHLQSRAARAWLAATTSRAWWTAYAGPELSLFADHAWTSGLRQNGSAWRPRLGFGLAAGMVAWMRRDVGVTLRTGLDLSPRSLSAELVVAGDAVLRHGLLQGYATLGVAYAFER
ncbi:MAG: hypothetical protein JW940_26760 [Polyangiaceae bacterium]|nr:hypothetical protein [Polyangiaceae bacterium]